VYKNLIINTMTVVMVYLAVRILNVITPGLIKTFVDLMRIISHSH
jgi:hypothetical protein